MAPQDFSVQLVLPCLDEEKSVPAVLALLPRGWRAVVVDNGSRDRSVAVAEAAGAYVISERLRGYGAAVDAGLRAASDGVVGVMDLDGSINPADLMPLAEAVRRGECDMAVGRRRPNKGSWPWPARLGNSLIAGLLNRRIGTRLNDLAPVRVAHRSALLALNIQDRRSGYPVETVMRAKLADWRILEFDIPYSARTAGSSSKVTGSFKGTLSAVRDVSGVIRRTRREWQAA